MSNTHQKSNENVKLKYSKSSSFYLNTKKDFFTDNDKLLNNSIIQNQLYASQEPRINCKICQSKLNTTSDFQQNGIEYSFCNECGHLNGIFEDTKLFIENLYSLDSGTEYAKNYLDINFDKRTSDIYIPKVEFLLENIPNKKYKLLDIGCGSGYFVHASLQKEIEAIGMDISKAMTDYGNKQISLLRNISPLKCYNELCFFNSIKETQADIVSALGVIEHLREPQKLFEAFRECKATYLYYSVPMFSLSVILENIFNQIFPRQLSGGHTHLFTESSIKKMNSLIGVKPIAEWRFGTDMLDLYRSCTIMLSKNNASKKLLSHLQIGLGNNIDKLQAVFDNNHFCSEIHLIASKN
ncbi:class I SAM-dependent methyltransferase [Fluviispira multicolorata]|uniref:Methyltransferase domain-containing protein n=1 Tax=Fluviispira multicolorata TaxID=2654512 RepID=A0A833JB31_9BACT|nr:methyltransferase domain-containing protein [Fluviispira multicolorata]KAB8028023.1 methyltransferase domain-containing protein [Fluviispira multicolorata]